MNIVIIGASDLGVYIAGLFSQNDYRIILIDKDPYKLEQITRDLDIASRTGDGTDWEILEELLDFHPDLFIALTNSDETNLVSCHIAKQLGYKQTVARVRKNKYFLQSRLNFEQLFSVDHLISPERLTASAMASMILIPGSIAIENFSHGTVQLRTVKIPPTWRKEHVPLMDRDRLELPKDVMVGLIKRDVEHVTKGRVTSKTEQFIFPHGQDMLKPRDEVTFVGEARSVQRLHKFLGTNTKPPKSAVIIGGSLIGINLARLLLDRKVSVMIIERDYEKCRFLTQTLPLATIIHRNGTDSRYLASEKVGQADVFVSCTRSDETNFLAGTIAKDLGSERVIIALSDTNYLSMVSRFGISQAASPLVHAANRILSIARERTVTSMVSLYHNLAEVMEIKVSLNSKLVGIPIKYLGPELPKELLIMVIQSRGRMFIADGSRVLSPGDTVIIMCHPKHIEEVRKLF